MIKSSLIFCKKTQTRDLLKYYPPRKKKISQSNSILIFRKDQNMPKKIILAGGLTALIISVLLVLIMINSRQQEQIAELPPTTTETRIIPYEEETVEDYNLFTDNDAVMIQVGINGVIEDIYELTYDKSGNIIDKKLIESIETSKVQNRIIQQGMLDRIETTERIRTRLSEYIEHLKKSDIPAAFPYIQQTDRQLFSQQTLQDNATALNWQIESHAINADLEFIYPDYLTVFDDSLTGSQTTGDSSAIDLPKGKESLRANIPLGIIFQSDVIGRQAVELKLSCTKENDDWFFSYIGPTEITDIDRSEYRDDGGRTYGNTVGARLTLNKAII
ncbi:MAG TPA: hypothetical protein ENN77_01300, partial [Candidatus Wirthbacteria bacterium]|nr:hypothetical protein [Candidatus Wirthbacteria bacterium]